MTPTPGPLRLTRTDTAGAVRIELHGDFDYQDADRLLDAVSAVLACPGGLRDLHVDCTDMTRVDSTGLAVLLMIRRRTDAAGVRLHLDGRPVELERILQVTGTLNHFTSPHTGIRSVALTVERASAGTQEAVKARSSGQDPST
ncbi:STAS domain-containing protein [Streptomyces sp. NBC_01264]|uniref:STAS domain-containing protein n=1 Tax=Streptomyces sp. NBC_01264 TaxID=2903804 RepID=UPI0022546C2C|nr:STAS domain-containing protein [Streptomyces sp. NBC_01264]MCX4776155.1 STAS domain-containing protein [Streptomyces sp. NBC_01264]